MTPPTNPTKPDLNYVCPHCGQPAVAGNHFCDKTTVSEAPARRSSRKVPTGALVVAGVTFATIVVLWRFTGPASLVLAALGLLGFLLWKGRKKK
jgi:hypothetical protein